MERIRIGSGKKIGYLGYMLEENNKEKEHMKHVGRKANATTGKL